MDLFVKLFIEESRKELNVTIEYYCNGEKKSTILDLLVPLNIRNNNYNVSDIDEFSNEDFYENEYGKDNTEEKENKKINVEVEVYDDNSKKRIGTKVNDEWTKTNKLTFYQRSNDKTNSTIEIDLPEKRKSNITIENEKTFEDNSVSYIREMKEVEIDSGTADKKEENMKRAISLAIYNKGIKRTKNMVMKPIKNNKKQASHIVFWNPGVRRRKFHQQNLASSFKRLLFSQNQNVVLNVDNIIDKKIENEIIENVIHTRPFVICKRMKRTKNRKVEFKEFNKMQRSNIILRNSSVRGRKLLQNSDSPFKRLQKSRNQNVVVKISNGTINKKVKNDKVIENVIRTLCSAVYNTRIKQMKNKQIEPIEMNKKRESNIVFWKCNATRSMHLQPNLISLFKCKFKSKRTRNFSLKNDFLYRTRNFFYESI